MSRRQWFLVAVALVVILVSGLLFLDLRLARSRTAGDRGIGTYRGGDKLPPKMANAPVVSVAVEGDGAFAEAFRDALRAELWGNNPHIGNVEMVDGAPDAAGDIYMRIEIVREEIVWTPVYARAEVETRMAFSSDGDVSWRVQKPVVMTGGEVPIVKADGQVGLADKSWGLLSLPGYRHLVAKALAAQYSEAVETVWAAGAAKTYAK